MAWIEARKRQKRGPVNGPVPKPYTVWKVYWRAPSHKVRSRTFDHKADAQRFARDVEVRKDRGTYVDPSAGTITTAGMLAHYLATADLRETTRAKYETLGRLYLTEGFGARPIRSIGKADVREHLAALRDAGKGSATVESVARLLHRLLEVAVEEDRIGRNPAQGVHVAPAARREPRFLTEAEVSAIAAEVPDRYRALVWTLALAGLWIGEAAALRVKNVTEDSIRVVESSAEVGGRKVTGPPKNGKARTVDIAPELRKMLREHITSYSNAFDPEAYVLTGEQGGQLRQNAFRKRIFQPAAERAGIEPVPTVHDLRHTSASFMARSGFTLLEAAGQLGHAATSMTARYSHVFPQERQSKAARLGELIG